MRWEYLWVKITKRRHFLSIEKLLIYTANVLNEIRCNYSLIQNEIYMNQGFGAKPGWSNGSVTNLKQ